MANQSKVLVALNDAMEIPVDHDWNGALGVEYGPKGNNNTNSTGTVVFEGTISAAQWFALKIHLPDGTLADNFAAVGIGYIEVTGFDRIRARMSVAGGADGVRVYANAKKA